MIGSSIGSVHASAYGEPEGLPKAVDQVKSAGDWLAMEARARAGFGTPHDVLAEGSKQRAAFVSCAEAIQGLSPDQVEVVAYALRAFANAAARIPRG